MGRPFRSHPCSSFITSNQSVSKTKGRTRLERVTFVEGGACIMAINITRPDTGS